MRVAIRRRDVAALAEHGLDEDRRDVLWWHFVFEHRLELRDAVLRAGGHVVGGLDRTRDRVGIGRDVDLGEHRAIAEAVRRLRGGHGERTGGASVEAAAEGDDRLALRVLARELDRRFDGLRARVPEEDGVESARRHGA